MSDIALVYDNTAGHADAAVEADDLLADDGLETSAYLSLFTGGPSGWWGDAVPDVAGDVFGSKLHTLSREKDTPRVLDAAKKYAEEALAWMVEDTVAESVTCTAESASYSAGTSTLLLSVVIQRPAAAPVTYRYAYNWESHAVRATDAS